MEQQHAADGSAPCASCARGQLLLLLLLRSWPAGSRGARGSAVGPGKAKPAAAGSTSSARGCPNAGFWAACHCRAWHKACGAAAAWRIVLLGRAARCLDGRRVCLPVACGEGARRQRVSPLRAAGRQSRAGRGWLAAHPPARRTFHRKAPRRAQARPSLLGCRQAGRAGLPRGAAACSLRTRRCRRCCGCVVSPPLGCWCASQRAWCCRGCPQGCCCAAGSMGCIRAAAAAGLSGAP